VSPVFASITATPAEVAAQRSGDELVESADVVMDRALTLNASVEKIWPWLVQLGKQRAGWYLPRSVERFIPLRRRAIRTIDARWQHLAVGDVIPDYGGRHETFEVAHIDPPRSLVYRSRRGRTLVSWSLTLSSAERPGAIIKNPETRLHFRLRLGPVRHIWLASSVGDLIDAVTIAGLAVGLRERISDARTRNPVQ
jgi:hypothetical protein